MSNQWDPRNYGIGDAIKDGMSGTEVTIADDCVIKGYPSGKASMYVAADNEKGHASCDFYGNGKISPHRNN